MLSTNNLFSPMKIRGVHFSNRIVVPPMCQYSAHEGYVDDWHLVNLGRFAMGGAGLIITEATAVQKKGRITHGCPGLWTDEQIIGHSRIAQFISEMGPFLASSWGMLEEKQACNVHGMEMDP